MHGQKNIKLHIHSLYGIDIAKPHSLRYEY